MDERVRSIANLYKDDDEEIKESIILDGDSDSSLKVVEKSYKSKGTDEIELIEEKDDEEDSDSPLTKTMVKPYIKNPAIQEDPSEVEESNRQTNRQSEGIQVRESRESNNIHLSLQRMNPIDFKRVKDF